MKKLLFIVLLFCFNPLALADWTLDNERSQLNFNSVKNESIIETHRFITLQGSIADEGNAKLRVELSSVDTKIALRDDRLRQILFETLKYPQAEFVAQIDKKPVEKLAVGDSMTQTVQGDLQLHGKTKSITASVKVTRLADGALEVTTEQPILVNADDFGLQPGIEKLREMMGLKSINTQVPVSFHLVFVEQAE